MKRFDPYIVRHMKPGILSALATRQASLLPAFVLLAPLPALAALSLAALLTVWLARLFLRRLGGHTGDLLGAVQQVTELACYVGIVAVSL